MWHNLLSLLLVCRVIFCKQNISHIKSHTWLLTNDHIGVLAVGMFWCWIVSAASLHFLSLYLTINETWFAVHMIVATPGRILDLMNKELVKTDECKILVLDEVGWLRLNYSVFIVLSDTVHAPYWNAFRYSHRCSHRNRAFIRSVRLCVCVSAL